MITFIISLKTRTTVLMVRDGPEEKVGAQNILRVGVTTF